MCRVAGTLNSTLQINNMIISIEKEVTDELQQLLEMRIFPSAELAIIRKDKKTFLENAQQMASLNGTSNSYNHSTGSSAVAVAGDQSALQSLDPLLEQELILVEKKLSVFKSRRVDEKDILISIQKRIVRNKQIEEKQAKDPANFKNQKRF
jgi:hypothetical protein